MAQLFQFPVFLKRGTGNVSQCLQRRQFSRILPLLAAPPKQPSAKPASLGPKINKEALNQGPGAEREDYGILPGIRIPSLFIKLCTCELQLTKLETFIMPTGAKRPGTFSKDFYKLMRKRLLTHARDVFSIWYFKWMMPKPRPIIRLRATRSVAIGLQRQLYQAFAAGDVSTLKEICGEGLYNTMVARIHNRKPGERMVWEMVKEKGSKVVSHRATPLHMREAGIRQAVVRIKSVQKLTRYDAEGKMVAGSGKEKEVVEYVVVQKRCWLGKEYPWKIWGTTEETTIEALERAEEEEKAKLM